MRLNIFTFVLFLAIMGLVFQPACKTSEETEETQFTLTVILSEGVNGEPVSGTYTHDQGDTVNYSYALMEGYQNLSVTLDGAEVPASGMVTMNSDHVLSAQAGGCQIDVRGKWKGVMVWPAYNPYYIYDLYFDVECFGDLLSGRLTGNLDLFPFKERGIYEVDGCEIRFEIELKYIKVRTSSNPAAPSRRSNGSVNTAVFLGPSKLIFWGTAEGDNRISGRWEMNFFYFSSVQTSQTNGKGIGNFHGTFSMERE